MQTKSVAGASMDQWQVSVYMADLGKYEKLNLQNVVYPNWVISHVLEGRVITSTGGEHHEVNEGGVMLHPPFLPFSEVSTGPGIHEWVSVQIHTGTNLDLFQLYPVHPVVDLLDPVAYSAIFRSLFRSWRSTDSFKSISITADMLRLATMILESWDAQGRLGRSEAYTAKYDRFFPIIRYMSEHLDQKLSRDMLAEQVHLNTNYFDRAFHEAYGINPMQMLRQMRLNKAKRLLESTEGPLIELAQLCGLGDAAYLSRQFVKTFGMTPGKYKQMIRSAQTNLMELQE
ncbi:helix-turn-helix domain-containing protein [Paenibacillus sp. OV219]|uniref:helix-turn-helix domain-containing protein n=1 Tax=Paenibacillus sp. OV219 TaxID=1884377 RepID=UPI0008B71B5F|nr:AraC family transcriptional regulator [Paenibacillus sp. OV219]SEO95057.1 Helix-turn-helix domain-containing protein [Paenibacillus sp. OV219]